MLKKRLIQMKKEKKAEEEELKKAKENQEKHEEPVKRSSINSIPLPDLNQIVKLQNEPKEPKEEIKKVDEISELRGELCNSYKFVVNYGVFEQNFEWLPQEVSGRTELCCVVCVENIYIFL